MLELEVDAVADAAAVTIGVNTGTEGDSTDGWRRQELVVDAEGQSSSHSWVLTCSVCC
jgi:hypothetical protein